MRALGKNLRPVVQFSFTALSNGYLKGFSKGSIFTGPTKAICVPGLNCYSCPGALGACPIGALQATLGSRHYKFAFYVLGFLMIFGALLGRFVCGWLCPFGLIQDLLYKIPLPKGWKHKKLPGEKWLRLLRYLVLAVLVVLLPLFAVDLIGQGKPWFCSYLCPAGTLGGGLPLVLQNEGLRSVVGFLYAWKVTILAIIFVASVFLWRPFCRYLCPLGAIYGLFNPVALARYQVNKDKCTQCGVCKTACQMDIPVWQKPNSTDCIRCGACKAACPCHAISLVKLQRKAAPKGSFDQTTSQGSERDDS